MDIIGSPDISVLDFAVLFDISTTTPTITMTNQSVGTGLANCTWWYKITDPSGAIIHEGTQAVPDKTGVWAPFVVPDTWPQPYGQINYSGSAYAVELSVKDSADNVYTLEKSQDICRPSGLTPKVKGNYGVAKIVLDLQCATAELLATDVTSYTYKGNTGTQVSKVFKVDYPLDDTGTRPPMFVLNDFTNALVPVPINGDGYTIFLDTIMDYTFSNDITVRIKYKTNQQYAVYCNIDLCPLVCSYQALVDQVEAGQCANDDLKTLQNKLAVINAKMAQALMAKVQPGCGIDLPKLIEEIKEIGGFDCDCYTTGNNGTVSGALNISFDTCGNITATADVNGDNVAFTFKVNDVVVALSPAMLAAGFTVTPTLDIENCTKTYTIDLTETLGSNCPVTGPIEVHGTDDPPADCPGDFYGPDGQNVWSVDDTTIIGVAKTPAELVAILNSNAGYRALGIAVVLSTCEVAWYCLTGAAPVVHVSDAAPDNPGCIDFYKTFPVDLLDYCDDVPITAAAYPANMYVQYTPGGTKYLLGVVTSPADLVTKLTAEANKPANQTYAENADSKKVDIIIYDEDCDQVNTTSVLYDRTQVIVYGANHHSAIPNVGSIDVVDMNSQQYLGKICQLLANFNTLYPYHMIRINNLIYTIATGPSGILFEYDISNPLYPTVGFSGPIPTPPGCPHTAFTNLPLRNALPSYWDGFFPTDINAQVMSPYVYFMESGTGCIWRFQPLVGFVAYFWVEFLIGKCARVVRDNKMYLTQDGFMEPQTGQNSGVPRTHIVVVDLNVFNASAVTSIDVAPATDEPWGMCIDPANPQTAYIVTVKGAIIEFDLTNDVVANTYLDKFDLFPTSDQFAQHCNVVIHNGVLYASSWSGTFFIDLDDIPTATQATRFEVLNAPSGAGTVVNILHYNFVPVAGECYGLLCYDNTTNPGGIAKYTYDGKFLGLASVPVGDVYNVIPINNVPSPTPNGLC